MVMRLLDESSDKYFLLFSLKEMVTMSPAFVSSVSGSWTMYLESEFIGS